MPVSRLDQLTPLLGRDLRLQYTLAGGFFEDADVVASYSATRGGRVDLETAAQLDNLTQAVANRLKTRKGELSALGHPEYGSRHHELMGEPNVPRTRNLIKLYVLQALRDEPRIRRVLHVEAKPEHEPPRDSVRIEVEVELEGLPTPLNLVVPFSLGGTP
jgi:phage baseplate assembly protein W